MAGRKRTAAEKRADELTAMVTTLDGLNLALAHDMLEEYSWMVVQMQDLKAEVNAHGVVEVVVTGGENNRHERKEESKHFIAYQRLVPKVIATASAIKKFVKDNEKESVATDEFEDW